MKKIKAFTLVEMLVVVFIIGIIVAAAVPAFNNFYNMYKFKSSMNQLVTDIRAARQYALTINRPVKITPVNPENHPLAGRSISGYAIYSLRTADIQDATVLDNWEEVAPGKKRCGQMPDRPRFFPFPVQFLSEAPDQSDPRSLKDFDGDNKIDIVFLQDGSFWRGPQNNTLTFEEDLDNPLNSKPGLVLKTPAKVPKNRYYIYFSLSGKVSVIPYHQ